MATKLLSKFVTELKYEDLPKDVVNRAKQAILDYLGSTLAGYNEHGYLGKKIINMMVENGGKPEATILGSNSKVPVLNAALANGVLSHIAELDDGHRRALGHPAVTAITSAIVMGERTNNINGKKLITAVVAGYEIFIRIAGAINPSHLAQGFHTTGTCGVFAAVAAAAKILDLDMKTTANSFGIAGVQGAGLMEVAVDGQMIKPIHSGKAAQAGVLAALLAKEGVEGPKTIIEGKNGFVRAMSKECDFEFMTEGLNRDFHILNSYVKLYPSCRHTHPPIDAALALRNESNKIVDNISEINIYTYPAAINITGTIYKPKTVAAAKFSMPYCVAIALLDGQMGLKQFSPNRFTDDQVLNLIEKIKIYSDSNFETIVPNVRGAKLTIKLKDGSIVEKRVELPKGERENPATMEEIKEKFNSCAEDLASKECRARIIKIIDNLENEENIAGLVSIY